MSEIIARVIAVAVLAAFWIALARRCVKAADRLNALVDRVRERRTDSFPEAELPPLSHTEETEGTGGTWTRVNEDGTPYARPGGDFPDAEVEKTYPYYNRTGQIVFNAKNRTLSDIRSGQWYGYSQWLQDILSSKTDPAYFQPERASTEKGDKK